VRRAALLAVSALLLAWLWRDAGGEALRVVLAGLDSFWLAAALALFLPTVLVTALRWRVVAAEVRPLFLGEALRMVLGAAAANLFLPAKLGDVGKGAFLARDGEGRAEGMALALFEKLTDVAALAAWMVLAFLGAPPAREAEQLAVVLGLGVVTSFGLLCVVPLSGFTARGEPGPLTRAAVGVAALRARPGRFAVVLLASFGLWGLHLLQFQCAAWAAGVDVSPALLASRIPMAIFVGLLPVSFAGIGPRDAALVYLLAPAVGEPVALALGAFATLRYVVPAAGGLALVSGLGPSRGG